MHFEIWRVEICGVEIWEVLRYAVVAVLRYALHSSPPRVLTRTFSFQITHVHHVRAFINQPVRADQEEQVPGVFSAAGAQVCTQLASVSGHPVQKQNNPLWYEAGERATQAAGSLRNQGRNLSLKKNRPKQRVKMVRKKNLSFSMLVCLSPLSETNRGRQASCWNEGWRNQFYSRRQKNSGPRPCTLGGREAGYANLWWGWMLLIPIPEEVTSTMFGGRGWNGDNYFCSASPPSASLWPANGSRGPFMGRVFL